MSRPDIPLNSSGSFSYPPSKAAAATRPPTLEGLLLVNSIFTIGTGMCCMFAPRFIANPRTWTVMKQEEWQSGTLVIGLRNLFGCASMALGVSSLLAYFRPREKVTAPVLAGLAFYHISILGPILVDNELFQMPEVLIHGMLGLGFVNFAMKDM